MDGRWSCCAGSKAGIKEPFVPLNLDEKQSPGTNNPPRFSALDDSTASGLCVHWGTRSILQTIVSHHPSGPAWALWGRRSVAGGSQSPEAWPEFLFLCRTPCPVTMPHPCAAQWITNPPHPRRRRWLKRLRRATSPRSVSLKVRDRAGWRPCGQGEMGVERGKWGKWGHCQPVQGAPRLPELSPNSKPSCTTTDDPHGAPLIHPT